MTPHHSHIATVPVTNISTPTGNFNGGSGGTHAPIFPIGLHNIYTY